MNDFFSELLKDKDVKTSPDIWFERIVLYRDMAGEPIQDFTLKRGLNVIQAGDDSAPNDISGHGTGKTTFCRMLRYLLGEPTYANKRDTKIISQLFKNGCIAAELHVRDKKWAVRRPFDNTSSFAIEDGSIEDVLVIEKNGIPKSGYVKAIGLDFFCEGLSFRDGGSIQWGHLLAWMTRDQEARLADIHIWRDKTSDSGAPAFSSSKQAPLFLMRAVLGLLTPNELVSENELINLERVQKETEENITVLKNRPELHIKDLESGLRRLLKEANARPYEFDITDDEAIETFSWEPAPDRLFDDSLSQFSERFQDFLVQKCQALSRELEEKKNDLEEYRVSLAGIKGKIRINEAIVSNSSDALQEIENSRSLNTDDHSQSQIDESRQRIEAYLKRIEKIKQEYCEYGQREVGICSYFTDCVNNQIERIKADSAKVSPSPPKPDDSAIIDRHTIEQNEAKAQSEKEQSESRLAKLTSDKERIETAIEELDKEKQNLERSIEVDNGLLRDIRDTHNRIVYWRGKLKHDPELVEAEKTLEQTIVRIDETNKSLASLIETHQKNTSVMGKVFDCLVKSILSPDNYRGTVELTKERELLFTIFYLDNPSVSVAINVLKTILADISSLIYASVTDGVVFPRFLIHDSPREADLQRSHYDGVFSVFPLIQSLFADTKDIPFQYIVTTTTAPPACITTDFLPVPAFDARDPQKMFLKCRLEEEYRKERDAAPLIDDTI